MKKNGISKKTYLIGFLFVMLLNIGLVVFLIRTGLAQTSDDALKNQPPIMTRVLEQKNCPLLVIVMNVDNSAQSYQRVIYVVQNVGNKPIRAYTILGDKIITVILTTNQFETSESKTNELFVERQNINSEEVLLSVDYVEFEDGSFWGNDTQKESERIAGERIGRANAIKKLNELIQNNDLIALRNLLDQDITKLSIPVSDLSKTDKWQKGFQSGYKVVISVLQQQKTQDIKAISLKLNEMKNLSK